MSGRSRSGFSLCRKILRSSLPVYLGRFLSFMIEEWKSDVVDVTELCEYDTSEGILLSFNITERYVSSPGGGVSS